MYRTPCDRLVKIVVRVLDHLAEIRKMTQGINHPFEETIRLKGTAKITRIIGEVRGHMPQSTSSMFSPCIAGSCKPMAGGKILQERTLPALLASFLCPKIRQDGVLAMSAGA
jgi:hypothetical protein